jgi:hypothetical protein
MSDINLDESLRALRESAANEEAPVALESALLREFRRHHSNKGRQRVWIGVGIGVAASLFIALVWNRETRPVAVKMPPPIPILTREPKSAPAPLLAPQVIVAARASRRRVSRKVRAVPQAPPVVGTDFIPLPYAPELRGEDSAAIVRVKLPRYSLQTVGLPFNPERANERIDADVLMGQDGIARAIRFVH